MASKAPAILRLLLGTLLILGPPIGAQEKLRTASPTRGQQGKRVFEDPGEPPSCPPGYRIVEWKGYRIRKVHGLAYRNNSGYGESKAVAFSLAKQRGQQLLRQAAEGYLLAAEAWVNEELNGTEENRKLVEVWRYDPPNADLASRMTLGVYSPGYECFLTVSGWFLKCEKLADHRTSTSNRND